MNAIYVWGVARARGADVLLRIEDHDRIRSRPQYEAALLEDLDWLGFVPDAGRDPVTRQSDRDAVYLAALDRLRAVHHVYACDCSRRTIGGEQYIGRCRERGLVDGPGLTLRVRIDPSAESFIDLRLGPQTQVPADQCGDLAIRDRDGQWTYQFAVTVDDFDQGITLVVRGEDLLGSTGRQLKLARMLGRERAPLFLHHPLLLGSAGEKLSKSAGDTGVRELRERGATAADVLGRAAAAAGLIGTFRPITAAEVGSLFA